MAISTSPKIYIKIPPIPSTVIQKNIGLISQINFFAISIYSYMYLL